MRILLLLSLFATVAQAGYTIDPHDPDKRGRLWPDGIVKYKISPQINSKTKKTILDAIDDYHRKTLLRWEPRINEPDYVEFSITTMRASGAALGMQVGRQEIKIKNGASLGTLIHEMGHTVGLMHEFSNPAMIRWVTFVGNAQNESDRFCRDYFLGSIKPEVGISDYSIWDTQSVMHYNHGCFLNRNAPLRVNANYPGPKKVWSDGRLSAGDAKTINALYTDKRKPDHSYVCENDPRVSTCDQFKAKGDCESYGMQIAAYSSCKKTCGLCKGETKKKEPEGPCVELFRQLDRLQCRR